MSRLICILIIALAYECSSGAPIAMMMGCGKGKPLSPEKQSFCCEHFNLDCPTARAVDVDSVLAQSLESDKNSGDSEFKVHMRTLGERCKPPLFVCGVGLECKQGLCFRIKTRAHLKRLISRGRDVELEEKQQIRDGEDIEDKDPLPARKGLILEGQSLKLTDGERRTPLHSMTDSTNSVNKRTGMGVTDLEEDELAANIGDLLAKKMGIKLSSKQIHNVREVIAGTIDERAEREEQIDEAEGKAALPENETETTESEKFTTPGIDTTSSSSSANEREENRSTSDNFPASSDSSLESEFRQLRADCGSHSDVHSERTEMQCPAKGSRRNIERSNTLVDIESTMVKEAGVLQN